MLAPIPRGSAANGKMTLQPGWTIGIDDFNFDVLTFAAMGSLQAVLELCPNKYDSLFKALQTGAVTMPNISGSGSAFNELIEGAMSCSDRSIVPGEGLSAVANLTYKGFISGKPRQANVSLTWQYAVYPVQIPLAGAAGAATYNFVGPAQAQLTIKQGNTGDYRCQIGQVGNPKGSQDVPDTIEVDLQVSASTTVSLILYATTATLVCIKHDREEAGAYGAETQVWVKGYVSFA